mmetsp:Transcript_18049/g.20691  ORF Transcript_18049/g.20691 Transcript_18049/m.20691 type:complete len:431 (-) Transcript_18049:191-1483(-)
MANDKLTVTVRRQVLFNQAGMEALVLLLRDVHAALQSLGHTNLRCGLLPASDGCDGNRLASVATSVPHHDHRPTGKVKLLLVRFLETCGEPARQRRSVQVTKVGHRWASQTHLRRQQVREVLIASKKLCNGVRRLGDVGWDLAVLLHKLEEIGAQIKLLANLNGRDLGSGTQLLKLLAVVGRGASGKASSVQEGHGLDGHRVVGTVEEQSGDFLVEIAGARLQLCQHVFDGHRDFIKIHHRGVGAREHGEIGDLPVLNLTVALHEVTLEWLAEIGTTVRGGRTSRVQVQLEETGLVLKEHGHGAGTLCLLTGGTAGILGNVRGNHDGHTVLAVGLYVTCSTLHGVDATEARVLELGDLAVAREASKAHLREGAVHHATHNDGASSIVRAGFRSEAKEADSLGIHVVLDNEAEDSRGGHGVAILIVSWNTE